jgi:hypothetical protein
MMIEEQPAVPESPALVNPETKMSTDIQQNPTVSPLTTPQIIATNVIHDPVFPLNIRDDVASKFIAFGGGISLQSVARDTDVVGVAGVSDDASQALPTQDDPPVVEDLKEKVELTRESSAPEDITKHENLRDDDLLEPHFPGLQAAAPASDSGRCASPETEPVSTSVKAKQSRKRVRGPVDLEGLPDPADDLTEAQIASLCSQPPRVRQLYPQYFAKHGAIRAAYSKILFERLPGGGLRFSEDVLRSCLPRWKEHLEAVEPGESSHAGTGQGRKRKGTATAAKHGADEDVDSHKRTKKSSASRSEESPVDTLITEPSPSLLPIIPPLRLRPMISRRTALATGLPVGAHTSQHSAGLDAGSSEALPRDPVKGLAAAALGQNQTVQTDSSHIQHNNPSDVPNMEIRRALMGNQPGSSGHIINVGGSQPLDPVHLAILAQHLTSEIQQMDFAILGTAHTSRDQGRIQRLRALWDALVNLRNLCVDMEIEQRSHMVSKDRDGMGKL